MTCLPLSQVAPVTNKIAPWTGPVITRAKPYAPAAGIGLLLLAIPPVCIVFSIIAFLTAPVQTSPPLVVESAVCAHKQDRASVGSG